MKYKNLNFAFLIEILIGLGTILTISLIGYKGLVPIALLALRPLVLEREEVKNEKEYWQFSYKIMVNSVLLISLLIIILFVIGNFFPQLSLKLPPHKILFIEVIPFFILTHGVVGIVNSSNLEQKK